MFNDQNPYASKARVKDEVGDDRGDRGRLSVLSVGFNVMLIAAAMSVTIWLMTNFVIIVSRVPRQYTVERMIASVVIASAQVGVTIWCWFILTSFCSWTWRPVAPQLRRWYVAVGFILVTGVVVDATIRSSIYGFDWHDLAILPYFEYVVFLVSYAIAAAPIVLFGIGYPGLARRLFRCFFRSGSEY